ncbi:protein SOSEKI 3 [Quercus suber]|uniref:protein SOSEKI 3 n=1 Tax=Quercus suber TaxID=58331 RepID=UPI0032DEC987
MEARMKKYRREVSPERSKVWTEKSPKYQQNPRNVKVAVVYYLCRHRQLEHPHFMEVPLSSSDGLFLRDVIDRLNVLRGRGMASMYSWSCKRNVFMQLISCGSVSVKDHSFGLIPTYKPRFSHSKFPSPLFSNSIVLGELDCLSENPRLMGIRLEDKEYFSGSLIETKMLKEEGEGVNSLKRSSSCNADRICKQLDPIEHKEESTSGRSKCIPRSIKTSLSKQPRSESMKSPVSDRPRNSSDGADSSQTVAPTVSNSGSKRITEPSSGRKQSKRLDSFREEEKVIKIEESLLQELGL